MTWSSLGSARYSPTRVRVSAGVDAAIAPADIQIVLQRADSALYQAKRAGRDRTVTSRSSDAHALTAVAVNG